MIRRLLAAVFPPSNVKRLVGEDHLGNKYYEMEKADGKKRRFLERSDGIKPEDYVQGMIPNQWEAWIRGRIDTPPTVMELLAREKNEKLMAIKAEELKKRDDEAQRKAYEDGLITRSVPEGETAELESKRQLGHASSHFYGPTGEQSEPSTVSGKFEPGAWKPDVKRTGAEAKQEAPEKFEPESWTPPQQQR